MGEISKLGWLIGVVEHAMWADSLYFLHLVLCSTSKTLASTYKTMDKVQNKPNSSVQHTPSSESFQVCNFFCYNIHNCRINYSTEF
jgi:hypothetical protein